MIPKSMSWEQVYEWNNYRLACALMNSRKDVVMRVLDPFDISLGWFALELHGFQVVPGFRLSSRTQADVTNTIEILRLNDSECCDARREFATAYWCGDVSWGYLKRHAPFVALELNRQGKR